MFQKCYTKTPAKVILTGEHFVIKTKQAITCAIDKYIYIYFDQTHNEDLFINKKKFDLFDDSNFICRIISKFIKHFNLNFSGITIEIKSEIEQFSGFGSSSAFLVGLIFGLNNFFKSNILKENLINFAIEMENFIHEKSSGIDIKTVVSGGIIIFNENKYERINNNNLKLCVINTGKVKFLTKDVINFVSEKKIDSMSNNVAILYKKFVNAMKLEDYLLLNTLISENQKYLENIKIVTEIVQNFIKKAQKFGLYFKVSGAGTIGPKDINSGILIGFCEKNDKNLQKLCKNFKYKIENLQISNEGLQIYNI